MGWPLLQFLQMLQVQLAPGTAVPRALGPQAWTRMVRNNMDQHSDMKWCSFNVP